MEVAKIDNNFNIEEIMFNTINNYGKVREFIHVFSINEEPVISKGEVFRSDILQQMIVNYN